MSLFNLFKKSDKKEPAKNGSNGSPERKENQGGTAQQTSTDNPFFSPEQQKKRFDAAMEFLGVFQQRIPLLDGKPHPGTVISVAARLAGTSLFRSIHKKRLNLALWFYRKG